MHISTYHDFQPLTHSRAMDTRVVFTKKGSHMIFCPIEFGQQHGAVQKRQFLVSNLTATGVELQ
jgi:hypothetical protein